MLPVPGTKATHKTAHRRAFGRRAAGCL